MWCELILILAGVSAMTPLLYRLFRHRLWQAPAAVPMPVYGVPLEQLPAGAEAPIAPDKVMEQRQLRLLRTAISRLNDIVVVTEAVSIDEPGPRIVFVNEAFERITGYRREEVLGRSPRFLQGPETSRATLDRIRHALESRQPSRVELINYTKDGKPFWVELDIVPIADETGYTHWVAIERDITERKRAEEDLQLAAKAFANTADAIIITDRHRHIVSVNKAFSRVTGYTPEEALGQDPRILQSGRHGAEFYARMWESLNTTGHWQGEIWNRHKDGTLYPELLNIDIIRNSQGEVTHYLAVFTDISQRKQDEERLAFLAHHDALTGLPNRSFFQERCREALLRAERHGYRVGLLFIDLDGFKTVNDSLGHPVGDSLLQGVAERLGGNLRKSDLLARQGGDEFTVLLDELDDPQAAVTVAGKLLAALREPFQLEGHTLYISASIGIGCYPQDGQDAQTLLKNADTAMYRAKEEGRNTYRFFSAEMNRRALESLTLINSLRLALERNEFALHYQPRFDLAAGRVNGVEALLRWQHPDLGLVLPERFIGLAEESGVIGPLTEWVLRTACNQASAWRNAGLDAVRMAVNLSPRQFRRPDLVSTITLILQETGLDPGVLELEITESMVMQNPDGAQRTLTELKALGITVAIDDFGTGYSSLRNLKQFPIDYLKIDRSLIGDIPGDRDDVAITRAIIAIAKRLKLRLIAEGVETQEQHAFLQAEGCEDGQGYWLGRPQPAEELEPVLRRLSA